MKHFTDKWRLSIFVGIFAVTIIFHSSLENVFASTDNVNQGMYSTDSTPFEKPYGHWLAEYFKWFVGIPYDEHPRPNYDKVGCSPGQSDEVLFLSDILSLKEERNCVIPSGMAILLPTLSGVCWTDNRDNPPWNDETITECAKEGNNIGVISATLDGRPLFAGEVRDLQGYRAQSPFFNITVPENDIFKPGSVPGVWKAKVDGYFVFLEPLTPGNHTLRTTVSIMEQEAPNRYSSDLTYNLNVKP
jgi:hypothetical protein